MLICSCATPPADKPFYHSGTGSPVVQLGGNVVDVRIDDEHLDVTRAQMLAWVDTAARGVTQYLGQFPVHHVLIMIHVAGNDDSINGEENDGDYIHIDLGRHVSQAQLLDDWTMTHEMLHLAFPSLSDAHHWMNEGLSVYLEPIVRARSGIVSPERYWRELHEGLENGQPQPGDAGLDGTEAWGRTYWGGTAFWFLADVQIRQQTHGQKSIDDVIRKILRDGGNGGVHWSMQQVLDTGDAETGTHVMHDLYTRLALKPEHVAFDPVWQDLGVRYNHGNVRFDDKAPLASIRRAITAAGGK